VPDVAYVNGWMGALKDACVPVLDRGFLFADGVYEVFRTYGGRPFELAAHLERLEHSLKGLGIRLPIGRQRLERRIHELLGRSGYANARVYVQVTRGVARRQHVFPRDARPTLVLYVERIPDAPRARRGLTVVTLPDERWKRCHLKTVALLPNVLARQQAHQSGADEAILLGPGGVVREGTSSNVFVVRHGALWTHPLGLEILPGVSRQVVLDLAREVGLRVREARFRRAALLGADEVLLSSTALEIAPVVRVDGRRVGDGKPGPVAAALLRQFRARVAATGRRPAAPGRRRA
jgi:D-alanine transaminase